MPVSGSRSTRLIATATFVLLCVSAGILAWKSGPDSRPAAPTGSNGRAFYVSPSGSKEGDGSEARPLDLRTALSSHGPVGPGDTVWLLGGTYRGSFVSTLQGTESSPIMVRQAPGERATIDSAPSPEPALYVEGAWTTYWGFELTSSDTLRVIKETGSHPSAIRRGVGLDVHGPHTRFIDLVVHDLAGGFGIWTDAVEAEAYGNLVYHNGWEADDRAHGHGIYTQNRTGRRLVAENIVFGQFSHGIHAYGSGTAYLDGITLIGNVVFNNGELDPRYFDRNILLGGERPAADPIVSDNFTYYSPGRRHGGENNFGYNAGCTNLVLTNNYFAGQVQGGIPIRLGAGCGGWIAKNLFFGPVEPSLGHAYPDNTYLAQPPRGLRVFVRRNRYEAGRANVVVYNWDRLPEIDLDLSSAGLHPGDRFELRDAENFFGLPVASGEVGSGPVHVDLRRLTVQGPVGSVPEPGARHTAPEFAVFVLTTAKEGSVPSMMAAARDRIADAWSRLTFRRP